VGYSEEEGTPGGYKHQRCKSLPFAAVTTTPTRVVLLLCNGDEVELKKVGEVAKLCTGTCVEKKEKGESN